MVLGEILCCFEKSSTQVQLNSSNNPQSDKHKHSNFLLHFTRKSDSGSIRFPRYQNIQKTRLTKMMRGPDRMRKSQKLKGAKMPMKKRARPITSNAKARRKKKMQRPRYFV